jgi:alkylhydroperoxidase family enzyme
MVPMPAAASSDATWFPQLADGDTLLDRVANLRPAYGEAMRDVEAAIWSQDVLEPEILELCRLRIAQLLGADDVGNEQLRRWPSDPTFTERQRVCLGFAEQVFVDAQGVTDEQAAEVIDEIGDGGFLVLLYACGFFETTERARILLTMRSPE